MKLILLYSFLFVLGSAWPAWAAAQAHRNVPDSVSEKMKSEEAFRYANDPSYWKKPEPSDNSGLIRFIQFLGSPVMKVIMYVIVGLIILFIIYQVAVVNNFFVSVRRKRKQAGEELDGNDLMPENIDERITNAVDAGEYRLATRYLYLKTLNTLNERNRIRLHAKSTNNEYLDQMRQSAGFGEFAMLTRVYEYVWYGEFMPGKQQFERIHENFNQFISTN